MPTEMKELAQVDVDDDADKKSFNKIFERESVVSRPAVVDYTVEDVPPLPTAIFLGLQVSILQNFLGP
jgi:hypothetical protein